MNYRLFRRAHTLLKRFSGLFLLKGKGLLSFFVVQVTRFGLSSQIENSQTTDFYDNLNMYKTSHDSKWSYKTNILMALISQLTIGVSIIFATIIFICEGECGQIHMPFFQTCFLLLFFFFIYILNTLFPRVMRHSSRLY